MTMTLDALRLKNFRIYQHSDIRFNNSINYIVGGNGQGKTTILEAVYYLCTTKNYKSAPDSDAVSFSMPEFDISGSISDVSHHRLRIYYSAQQNKRWYFHNEKHVSRASEIIGKFPVVLLTPDDAVLTQGYAGDRRKFLDSVIAQSSETYLSLLLDYNRTLKQRGNLLQAIKEHRSVAYDELEAWDEKLATTGTDIVRYRTAFMQEFSGYIEVSYSRVSSGAEIPGAVYKTTITGKEEFLRQIGSRKREEIYRGLNLVGPHKDDIELQMDGQPVKKFASQGQQKSFQVSLRFAQYFYLKDKLEKKPLFLLDDVFGELDVARSMNISGFLSDLGQAFITVTDFSDLKTLRSGTDNAVIRVKQGDVTYEQ